MILSQTQAEAAYSAMCALNNVSGTLRSFFGPHSNGQHVEQSISGTGVIQVFDICNGVVVNQETHADQAAFAAAYKLDDSLYSIHDLADDHWLANTRAANPGAAIRDYLMWPNAKQHVYAQAA